MLQPTPLFGVDTQADAGSEVSSVHGFPSLQGAIGVEVQPMAGSQMSVVHALLSVHGGSGVNVQPLTGSQVSVVHTSLSLQVRTGMKVQPRDGSQVSAVQTLLSLQATGVKTQPTSGSQESVVHSLLSMHVIGGTGHSRSAVTRVILNFACRVISVPLSRLQRAPMRPLSMTRPGMPSQAFQRAVTLVDRSRGRNRTESGGRTQPGRSLATSNPDGDRSSTIDPIGVAVLDLASRTTNHPPGQATCVRRDASGERAREQDRRQECA